MKKDRTEKPLTLSVCLIVKNESAVLARCLDCAAKFADEIVVVDTGSSDDTRSIARKFTAHVFDFVWRDDFSAARNYAFSRAHGDYLMWLDADDVIEACEIEKIKSLKQRLALADTFMFLYHSGGLSYCRERILRNCPQACWQGRVHEVIPPFGRVSFEDITILHAKENAGMDTPDCRNLNIYRKMLSEGEPFSARDEFYYARELFYHRDYGTAIERFESFLSRADGWAENKIAACEHLADCFLATGDREKAELSLLRAQLYGSPRAEHLFKLGGIFFETGDYFRAAFYYQSCLLCKRAESTGGFYVSDCYGFLPCIQLCVCFSRMGDNAAAERYNQMAGEYRPDDPAYLYNVGYFRALRKREKSGTEQSGDAETRTDGATRAGKDEHGAGEGE